MFNAKNINVVDSTLERQRQNFLPALTNELSKPQGKATIWLLELRKTKCMLSTCCTYRKDNFSKQQNESIFIIFSIKNARGVSGNKFKFHTWHTPYETSYSWISDSILTSDLQIYWNTYVSISWGISSKSSTILWFASNVWFIFLFSKISSAASKNSVPPDIKFGVSFICKGGKLHISIPFVIKYFTII